MAKTSPLHRVIDAARWDAERLLGRLIIVVHAAFLDAGLVPDVAAAAKVPKPRRVPKQVGVTASTLSLQYTAPQMALHRRQDAAAVLRIWAQGRHVVFYVFGGRSGDDPRRPRTYWVCVDALAAAPFLSGGLDDTARSLRRDGTVAELWRSLADGMCRRVLVELCRENGVDLPGPTFMSLPGDAKAAILARLDDGEDLLRVSRTCTELRSLVADRDRELWKPRYEALQLGNTLMILPFGDGDDELPEMTWKESYLRATRRRPSLATWTERYRREIWGLFSSLRLPDDLPPLYDPFSVFDHHFDPPELPADDVLAGLRRSKSLSRHRRTLAMASGGGSEKRRSLGAGATHSPSSRYRWKHR